MSTKTQTTQLNSSFLILFITLNFLMLSCSGLNTSKISVNKNIIEIKSEAGFFSEIKNCIDSLSKGVFIHYDYSEEESQSQKDPSDLEDENNEEDDDDIFEEKSTHDKYSVEQDLATLKQLEKNLDRFKTGEINEEELKLTKIKIDRIMMKYNKKNLFENSNGSENAQKAEENSNSSYQSEDEEYLDEENQNSMVKAYVNDKLDDQFSNDIENTAFDEYLVESVKKLNILKLFTMEAKVDVNVAAVF